MSWGCSLKVEPNSNTAEEPTSKSAMSLGVIRALASEEDESPPRDMFVGNLSLYTDEEKLREYFVKFGQIDDVRIMYHPDSQKSRRFGFITFSDPSSMTLALSQADRLMLDGKRVEVKNAVKRQGSSAADRKKPALSTVDASDPDGAGARPPSDRGYKVFVGGIGQDTTQEEVAAYFSSLGAVSSVSLLPDRDTGRHRGFAFVIFAEEHSAHQACRLRYHVIKNSTAEAKQAKPRKDYKASQPMLQTTTSLLGEHPLQTIMSNAISNALVTIQHSLAQQQQLQLLQNVPQQQLWSPTPRPHGSGLRYSPYAIPTHSAVASSGTSAAAEALLPLQSFFSNAYQNSLLGADPHAALSMPFFSQNHWSTFPAATASQSYEPNMNLLEKK